MKFFISGWLDSYTYDERNENSNDSLAYKQKREKQGSQLILETISHHFKFSFLGGGF